MRLIDADALQKSIEANRDASDMPKMWYEGVDYAINHIIHAPTIEPEVMSDGTLHITVDLDISKIDRILLSQNGTHYGDLYYADGEPKIGKWIPHNTHYTFVTGETSDGGVKCSSCGFETHNKAHITFGCPYKFCPNCGSYNGGEANE